MLSAGAWRRNQTNTILFVIVDTNGQEVTGLGSTFTLEISKGGAAFQASAGTKSEVGSGWYLYTSTSGEADTVGPIAIKVSAAGAAQQNLEYVVESRQISAVAYTYTLTDDVSGDPLDGARVWICSDSAGANVVWSGYTDSLGVARDDFDNLPRLDPGIYYVFRQLAGYAFDDPDTEAVS